MRLLIASMILFLTAGATAAPAALSSNYLFCNEVYGNLINSVGRLEPTAPKLVIKSDQYLVAEIKPNHEIHIGEKFLDLCRQMGKDSSNALALVLGHELAHHYGNHFWAKDYGSAYANLAWGQKIRSAFTEMHKDLGIFESQADDFGMFFSYVAGYNTLGIATTLYDKIYLDFNLPAEIPGYPSLQERKEIALQSEERIKKLIPIFEAGKLLNILSQNQSGEVKDFMMKEAASCFDHIINQKFSSREMYNNLGVSYLLMALNIKGKESIKYQYPVLMDEESRLYDIGASRGGLGQADAEAKFKAYLEKAERYFGAAKQLDKTYAPPFINMACVMTIQGKSKYAVLEAEEGFDLAMKFNKKPVAAAALDIWGIALATQEKKNDAVIKISEAKIAGSKLSDYNLKVVNGEPLTADVGDININLFPEEELIAGKSFRDLLRNYTSSADYDGMYGLQDESALILTKKQANDATLYVVKCQEGDCPYRSVNFYDVGSSSKATTEKKIKVNNSVKQLIDSYGYPDEMINTSSFVYYLYSDYNIIFRASNDKVAGWINYAVF